MGVRDLNTKGHALVAEFAFGHVAYLLAMKIALKKPRQLSYQKDSKKASLFFEKIK